MQDEDFPPDQEWADSIVLCEQCDFSTHRVVRMVNEPGAPPKIWVPDDLLTFLRKQIVGC
ncbi:hypothetical protein F7734_45690 [Scytonema sp. UIC 10036]|uniref:hypothetical protein n=1 Tax=Scytonema sp. UIC 10036 TaxID=2304196 RepID=UPI0012DA20B7|nr:hypothetical protein [Scytonema sp. UIC 10036]MUG99201.1 hypothetical protein [Scytonema sp. UIC 10036]